MVGGRKRRGEKDTDHADKKIDAEKPFVEGIKKALQEQYLNQLCKVAETKEELRRREI